MADGNEIFSHTRNHIDANSATWDAATQVSGSSDDMAANLNGYRPTFLAWPSDIAADGALTYLRTAPGYIGGRAPNRVDANGITTYDGHVAGLNTSVTDDFQVLPRFVFNAVTFRKRQQDPSSILIVVANRLDLTAGNTQFG